jgi:hypothetical protein
MYYLRIRKRGKVLCLLEGQRLEYKIRGAEHMRDTIVNLLIPVSSRGE